jgi:hypothetical protein
MTEEAVRACMKFNNFGTWVDIEVDAAKASAKDVLSSHKDVNVIVRKMIAIIDQVKEEYYLIIENVFYSIGGESLI